MKERKTTTGKRKPYRPPRITVYGDLRRVTQVKGGNKADGAGKPATRASGVNA